MLPDNEARPRVWPALRCVRCNKSPEEIQEYRDLAKSADHAGASAACRAEEGTLNPQTGAFACTDCYIALGSPGGPGNKRWRAGDPLP